MSKNISKFARPVFTENFFGILISTRLLSQVHWQGSNYWDKTDVSYSLVTLGGYFNMFLFVLKTFSGSDIV
jgi:hypothetical protein